MVINRTKQLARKVRSPPDLKAHAAKMRDTIAARHGTKRPAVGGISRRARIKAHTQARKWGSRGKNTNTESDVSSDHDSDTETVYSYSSQHGDGDGCLPGEDASVSSSKISDFPSSLDVDGDNDTSLYRKEVSMSKLSDHEMSLDLDAHTDPLLYGENVVRTTKPPDNATSLAAPVESVSSSIDLDADTDPSLYGANDVPPPKPLDNETLVATPIEYVSLSLVTTPKPPDNKTAMASPVENLSSSIDLDADTDPSLYGANDVPTQNLSDNETSLYGTNDVPTQNLSDNETSEAVPDGQKHILIEAEIDSGASHDEPTPMVVTQTQALPSADADADVTQTQAVPSADADEENVVLLSRSRIG
jgi:hypothetical protein